MGGAARERGAWLLWLVLAACGDSSQHRDELRLPAAPSAWQVVHSSCGYSFRAPSDLRELTVQPFDSCVERFESGDCRIDGDFGRYGSDLDAYASEPEHRTAMVLVGGRTATVADFRLANPRDGRPYVAALYIPSIGPDSPETKLSLWVTCGSAASRDELEAVFGTIELALGTER